MNSTDVRCEVCNIILTKNCMSDHLKGKKHQKAAARLNLNVTRTGKKSKKKNRNIVLFYFYFCKSCIL